MPKLTLALLFAAGTLMAGCKSNETKPEEPAPAPAAAAAPAPAPAAEPAKPTCPPESTTKKKSASKSKTTKASTPPDCEPAKPKTEPAPTAKTVETKQGAAAGTTPSGSGSVKTGTECKPCSVKSRDGTFDGEVYGNIPANSKWARLQIGMHQSEVERILGVSHNVRGYVTGKAFIPFYFGSDSTRYEAVYPGQGSVAYTGGGIGGGQGVLMMINFDAKIQ